MISSNPMIHEYRLQLYDQHGKPGAVQTFQCVKLSEYRFLEREVERLTRERSIVTAALMGKVPDAPPVVEALQQFIKQWNACGPNSEFGRYFSNTRDIAVAALAKYQLSGEHPAHETEADPDDAPDSTDKFAELIEDAAKWRALRHCARITSMGSAGLHDADKLARPDAHVTLNFWTHGKREEETYPREWLDQFVMKVRRLAQKSGDDSHG